MTRRVSAHAARVWRDYRWWIIGALWSLALLLGYVGIGVYNAWYPPERPQTPLDNLYQALQLFVLNWTSPGPLPWQLEVSRFLAPIMAAYTAMEALAAVFFDQMQLLRVRNVRGHVVVCGLGNKGLLLAKAFQDHGYTVLVIERKAENELIQECRAQNIPVQIGDGSKADILRRARVQFASILIAVCGDDGTNAEIAANARHIVAGNSDCRLTCAVHIVNPDLWNLLRRWEMSSTDRFRLQFFNVYDIGARAMLMAYPPAGDAPAHAEGVAAGRPAPPRLLVVGAGEFAKSLVTSAVRYWLLRTDPNSREKMAVTLLDSGTGAMKNEILSRHPEFEHACEIDAVQIDIPTASFKSLQAVCGAAHGNCPFTAIYVCSETDAAGLSAALALHRVFHDTQALIVIRMTQTAGLATLLNTLSRSEPGYDSLRAFGLLDHACQPDLVLGGTTEMLAHAIHEQYVNEQQAAGQTPQDNSALVPWYRLPSPMQESNRRQAGNIAVQLGAINCDIAPLVDWGAVSFSLSDEEIDLMARLEHDRWAEERRLAGWSYGPRDVSRKTNPNLVDWKTLPEDAKSYNRAAARKIPATLAAAGFQIHRLTPPKPEPTAAR